jgi:D-alanyl-lipoteichoic acid acyltransferase DltB (MBOAT superfamily)
MQQYNKIHLIYSDSTPSGFEFDTVLRFDLSLGWDWVGHTYVVGHYYHTAYTTMSNTFREIKFETTYENKKPKEENKKTKTPHSVAQTLPFACVCFTGTAVVRVGEYYRQQYVFLLVQEVQQHLPFQIRRKLHVLNIVVLIISAQLCNARILRLATSRSGIF